MLETIEYFSFCPGIPWTVRKGYLIPKLTAERWEAAIEDKNIVILAYNGLIESFYSLTAIEAMAKIKPFKSLLWAGNPEFYNLAKYQSIAAIKPFPDVGKNYPTPLFFDAENNAYINCLNNYLYIANLKGRNKWPVKKPILEQIFKNTLLEWKSEYKPVFRDINRNKYEKWCHENKISSNQKFVSIIPNKTEYSNHKINCLNWNEKEWRELSALLRRFGIPLIVVTDDTLTFYNTNAIRMPVDLDLIIPLIIDSWALLAADIDFLLMAQCISNAILFSRQIKGKILNLYKHAELAESESVIFTSKDLNPMEIYYWCEGNYA